MHDNLFVVRTLLYLRLLSLWNLLRVSVHRLRQPRYMIGALMIFGYLWLIFLRPGRSPGNPFNQTSAPGEMLPMFAAVAVFLMIWLQWMLTTDKPGLRFSEAEIAFLFPAPVTRRQLIHFRLLDNLTGTMLSALVFMLIFNGTRLGLVAALRSWGAWWFVQAIMGFHGVAVALVLSRWADRGWPVSYRRVLVTVIGVLYLGALVALGIYGRRETAIALLWPVRLLVEPFFATPDRYLLALLPLAIILALHYLWVLKLGTPFEEASVEQARKMAERVANYRAGKGIRLGDKPKARNESFRLHAKLPMEFALLWKNLMVAPAYMNRRVFVVVAMISTAGILWLQQQTEFPGNRIAAAVGGIAMVLLGYLFAFGPQLATNDLRGELANADMLKAWPQPGWRIVLGSLLAPALQLSSIGWLFLFIAALGFRLPPDATMLTITPGLRVSVGISLAMILPLLFGLQLLVPNAFALIFPAWAGAARPAPGRMDIAGMRLLFFVAQLLFLVISLMPPLFVGSIIWYFSSWFAAPPVAVVLVAVAVFVTLLLELLYGVYQLGERFDAADLVAEAR